MAIKELKTRAARIDDNIYKRNPDGSYSAIGLSYDHDWLGDGLWYVRHHEHSTGITNGSYMQGLFELPRETPLTFSQTCDLLDIVDYIMGSEAYKELTSKPISPYEYVSKIVALTAEKMMKQNDK